MTQSKNHIPTVEVDGLTKIYSTGNEKITAVDDITFSIDSGSIVALLGPNGAGKTTVIKSILGLVEPTAGNVRILGEDPLTSVRAFQNVAAVLEGSRNIYWRLTVMENMHFFARLQGIDPNENEDSFREYIELLDLNSKRNEQVRDLSRGMKQKAALACTLACESAVIFLDEPTLGLDVEATENLIDELSHLAECENRTIILSSHDLEVVEKICERIIIMSGGDVIENSEMSELQNCFSAKTYKFHIKHNGLESFRNELEREFEPTVVRSDDSSLKFELTVSNNNQIYDIIDFLKQRDAIIYEISVPDENLKNILNDILNNKGVVE